MIGRSFPEQDSLDSSEQRFCTNCILDVGLLQIIERDGARSDECRICGEANVVSLNVVSQRFRSHFRALVRYHFSEWHYNPNFGGQGPEKLFQAENPITRYSPKLNQDRLREALSAILYPEWELPETGVSLYAIPDDVIDEPLAALKEDFDDSLSEIDYFLKGDNHFELEQRAQEKFAKMTGGIERSIPAGSEFYRARIGMEATATPKGGRYEEWHCKPFTGPNICAPLPPLATAGRMNRSNVSYLYVASDETTAIAEVRPHPGQLVSCATFRSEKDLLIADLSRVSISRYCCSDRELEKFLYLKSIEKLFALPISPDLRSRFMFTQFLADLFRHAGFQGVSYRSSLEKGTNLAFFNPRGLKFVDDSAKVAKIKKVRCEYQFEPLMDDSATYIKDHKGKYWERNYLMRINAE